MKDGWEQKKARELLDRHAQIKGPKELENYNIEVSTFLVFAAMKRICSADSVFSEAEITKGEV